MKCSKCGHENRTGAKFCQECAAPFICVCANCGIQLPPSAKFCSECAHPVSQATPFSEPYGAPETYTPKHLADKILTSKGSLEGERKQVTVLFADLKGSMELLADHDPEEVRNLLDPILERMMDAVHRYEGTVNKLLGDGIMALFGAPVAHEDHAVRACFAAIDMQAAMRRYADEVWKTHGIKPKIRVGLNSGEVVIRAIGSDLHMDYTAVGPTTHLAARMEQLADPGTILLTPETLQLAEGYVTVKSLGLVSVKGLQGEIEVYELTGTGPLRSRLQVMAARGLTRFVGRETEVDQLRQALGRASASHGQVVAIVGEPGVGKSRLVWEITHSHRVHGWLVLQASSVSYGKATSYLPVIDLLKGYFAIEERDDPRAIREKLTGKVLTLDRSQEGSLPALLSLLNVPTDDRQWPTLDTVQRRRQTLDAVKRLLLRESQEQPLLVVFEDLHWIDSETQALLDGLVESLPAARLLLLVNYRPEYQHHWAGRSYYTQLRLDPLPPETADELLGALLGPDVGLEPLKGLLVARTEGNPFFLEESVRALVETGSLSGVRGAYHLARPLTTIQVPATVQAVLAARIDRLSPSDKALLQTASVLGKDFPFSLLQAIAERTEEELRIAISRLETAEFVYETRLFPDLEYTFKHALTHDVVYGSILQERRRSLHRKIVKAIEEIYPYRLTEHIDHLAHHALRGEVWRKALTYLRQAGAKALTRSANREASAYFEQALSVLPHLPETREILEEAIDLRFDLRTSLFPLGQLSQVLGHLQEAERLASALDDQRRMGWISVYMTHLLSVTGRPSEAREFGKRARIIADALEDFSIKVGAIFYIGASSCFAGDYGCGREFLCETVRFLDGDLARERYGLAGFPAVMARAYLAWLHSERGEFETARAWGSDGVRLGESVDHPYSLIIACWGLSYLYAGLRELSQAVPLSERAFALARHWDLPIHSSTAMGFLGHAYSHSGRIADGLALLEQSVRLHESGGFGYYHTLIVNYLGEAYLMAERLDDALACSERALSFARDRKERGFEAWALRSLGEIAARKQPTDIARAEGTYRAALTLAAELGMHPLVARCHLGLGKLYRSAGQPEQARERLTTGTTMFQDMKMQYWLADAEAEMHQLG